MQSRRLPHDISPESHYYTLLLRSLHDDSTIAFSSITESIYARLSTLVYNDSSSNRRWKCHIESREDEEEGEGGEEEGTIEKP